MKFHSVLFDAIGTTILEDGEVIMNCFKTALEKYITPLNTGILRSNRGKNKKEMIIAVLNYHQLPVSLVEPVYKAFKSELEINLHRFSPNPGAEEIFTHIRHKNMKLGIGTGLEKEIFMKLYNHFQWERFGFDYIGSSPDLEHGRPHPAMILDMMKQTGCKSPESFLKVGDTIADIEEGKNAGVKTAVILSGSQDENSLLAASPDFVIKSLKDLIAII